MIGPVGPLLYQFASQPSSPFHDVTRGGNRLYDAAPGRDYAIGLGSPDVTKLANAMVAPFGGG
jgi:hypothetical protein